MAKSKKVTRALINKEIARIRNIVREAEEQGYIFNGVIPKNVNVTKSTLQRLRGISREDILNTARRIDVETGEIIPTKAERNREKRIKEREYKKRQRSVKQELKSKQFYNAFDNARQKAGIEISLEHDSVFRHEAIHEPFTTPFSEVVIQNFNDMFKHFPSEMKSRINGLIEQLINEQGLEDTAITIYSLGGSLISHLVAQGYDSDSIIEELGQALISNLPNASESYKKDISDMYESHETGYIIED